LKINEITINGSPYNHVKLNSTTHQNKLLISINGTVLEECQFLLEAILFDNSEIPVAVFSPTYKSNYISKFLIGSFNIQQEIELPLNMNSGDYYFDFYLNHPMVEGLVSFEKSFKIELEGLPTQNGFVYNYSRGYGYFSL